MENLKAPSVLCHVRRAIPEQLLQGGRMDLPADGHFAVRVGSATVFGLVMHQFGHQHADSYYIYEHYTVVPVVPPQTSFMTAL